MNLPKGWSEKDGMLYATFKCADFKHALELVNSIGDIAEKLQHHPDLGIRNYNEVFISTSTHETNSITVKDIDLAQKINELLAYENDKSAIETDSKNT